MGMLVSGGGYTMDSLEVAPVRGLKERAPVTMG